MGLFFDNKQHLLEMKKIYLLEQKVEKIENTLEKQILKWNHPNPDSHSFLQQLQEELQHQYLPLKTWNQFLDEQKLQPLNPTQTEQVQHLLEEKISQLTPQLLPIHEFENFQKEIHEQLHPTTLSPEQLHQIESLLNQILPQLLSPKNNSTKSLEGKTRHLSEKLLSHHASNPFASTKRYQNSTATDTEKTTTTSHHLQQQIRQEVEQFLASQKNPTTRTGNKNTHLTPPSPNLEEIEKRLFSQLQKQLQDSIQKEIEQKIPPLPSKSTPATQDINSNLQQQLQKLLQAPPQSKLIETYTQKICEQYLSTHLPSQLQKLLPKHLKQLPNPSSEIQNLQKQLQKLKKQLQKIKKLLLATCLEDDEDDLELPLPTTKKRKKAPPPTPPPPTLSNEQNAALESLFQMNMELQS